jgi:hypothetical protein
MFPKMSYLILEQSKSDDDDDYQYSHTYLTYDQKDKNKTKYILRLIDLEKLTNLTEFFVNRTSISHNHSFFFSI